MRNPCRTTGAGPLRIPSALLGSGLVLGGLLLLAGGCAVSYPQDQKKALEEVAAHLEKGDFQAALEEALWAKERFPDSTRALSVWALAAKTLALSQDPPDFDLLDQAERECLRAGRAHPRDPAPWFTLGVVRRDRGDLGGAVQAWEEALKAEPFHLPTLEALGDLQFSLGHERAAAVLYDRLLRLPPGSMKKEERALFSYRLGVCLLAEAELSPKPEPLDYDPAKKNFLQALSLDPGRVDASRAMAWLVVRISKLKGRWKEPDLRKEDAHKALAYLRKALARHPLSPGCCHDLGWLLEVLGDSRAAEEEYRKALSLDPEFVPALVDLAALVEKRGKEGRAEARKLRKKALDLTGDFALARGLKKALGGAK